MASSKFCPGCGVTMFGPTCPICTCPAKAKHTPCPKGYMAWHDWAFEMAKTHKQRWCDGCKRYSIWVPKKGHERVPSVPPKEKACTG